MAARRRVTTYYPHPNVLRDTVAGRDVSLDGVRRFLGSENVIGFASERAGLAAVIGEVWLRPSAVRRMGNYLDLAARPSLAGFTIQVNPAVTPIAGVTPRSLLEHFREVTEDTKRQEVERTRRLKLDTSSFDADDPWPWHGLLSYEHVYALAGGERIVTEAQIPLRARETADGDVDVAAVLRRRNEFEAVSTYLHSGLTPSKKNWLVAPVGLPAEAADRAQAFVNLLAGFTSVGDAKRVANPEVHRRELAVGEESKASSDRFLAVMKQAPYRTSMAGLDVMLERVASDEGILGGLNIYIWRPVRGGGGEATSLLVRHRPNQDDHLEVRWNGGRQLPTSTPPDLTDELWEQLPAMDWGEQAKTDYTVAAWGDVVTALRKPSSAATATTTPARTQAAATSGTP
jgi:hypothetical protein